MKNIFALVFLGLSSLTFAASASTNSCEQTVSISVAQMLHEDPKSDEIVHWAQLEKSFINLSVWLVGTGTQEMGGDVPVSGSYWVVTTRDVGKNGCVIENIVLDAKF